jgi:ferredoxin
MPRIVVDWDLCEANARCMKTAPEVFQVGDDDRLRLLVVEPNAEQLEAVKLAVKRCPKQALSLAE